MTNDVISDEDLKDDLAGSTAVVALIKGKKIYSVSMPIQFCQVM